MTEEEAMGKRCCGPEGCGSLRDKDRYCIGHHCMAWREIPEIFHMEGDKKVVDAWADYYCGLAGEPR